jgi:protein transport protein SEC61 subunit gamma-like protein|tara:strand:+ start:3377 stop:3547 length:171 start_codon:yes stop_codon:yes gene_type:complete
MNIKEKIQSYARILRVAKKPSGMEFRAILKVTGIGILLIGVIGFLIHIASRLITAA